MFKLKLTVAALSLLFPINNYSGRVVRATGLDTNWTPIRYQLSKEAGNISMSFVSLLQTKMAQLQLCVGARSIEDRLLFVYFRFFFYLCNLNSNNLNPGIGSVLFPELSPASFAEKVKDPLTTLNSFSFKVFSNSYPYLIGYYEEKKKTSLFPLLLRTVSSGLCCPERHPSFRGFYSSTGPRPEQPCLTPEVALLLAEEQSKDLPGSIP